MIADFSVGLGNLLLTLSDGVDLANRDIGRHQIRTAYSSWQIAKELGLPPSSIEKIFTAALLHDIGALTPEDKVKLFHFEEKDLDKHSIQGEWLFEQASLLAPSARIVRFHHRPWNEWKGQEDDPDALPSQVVFLADILDRITDHKTCVLNQTNRIRSHVSARSGQTIHPDVAAAFQRVSEREDFWLDLKSPRLFSLLLHKGPFRGIEVGMEEVAEMGSLFRILIDFRSPFTATHSTGVAECTKILAELFGFTQTEVTLLRMAGDFHDVGKLAIPNAILDKAGKLTPLEFEVIKKHVYFTYTILESIGGLGQIPEWAAFHHEHLDGSGYPFHVGEERISTGSRIVAVADVFTALAENRPYREGMPENKVAGILQDMVKKNHLDGRIVTLLLDHYDEVKEHVLGKQEEVKALFLGYFQEINRRHAEMAATGA